VLVEPNLIFQLDDVQLQIAAAEILCFEAKIVAGDGLHAQYGLVEFHRFREILGASAGNDFARRALLKGPPGDNRTQWGSMDAVIFPVSCCDNNASVRVVI
jgi:hypothetical protein